MDVLTDLYNSFFNNKAGLSGRRLTAFVLIVMVVTGDVFYFMTAETAFMSVLIDWIIVHLCGAGFFLGLLKIDDLIELKSGVKSTKTVVQETSKTTEVKSTEDTQV